MLTMKPERDEGLEPYEQILRRFEAMHHDLRQLENVVVQYLNRTGVTWDKIGMAVDLGDEGARRHYTKPDGPRRRKKT